MKAAIYVSFTLYSDFGGGGGEWTEVVFSFVMIPIKTIVISYQYCVPSCHRTSLPSGIAGIIVCES